MPRTPSRPKTLGFFSEDAAAWMVSVVVFVTGCLISAVLAWVAQEVFERQLRQRFEMLASERFTRIEERFADQVQRLDGVRRFLAYSPLPTRSQFNNYVRPLLGRTVAYTWAPRVTQVERASFEQDARAEGLQDFSIRDLGANGQLVPAAQRSEFVPVFFTQSRQQADAPLGYDMLNTPARRDTFQRARASGTFAVSPPVDLIGLNETGFRGVLMVVPVVGPSRGKASAAQPVQGFVSAVISVGQLMTDGLPARASDNLQVSIRDPAAPSAEALLFQSQVPASQLPMVVRQRLALADRSYDVELRPSAVFAQTYSSLTVSAIVVVGGLLSLLLSTLLYSVFSQRQRALLQVDERTAQLMASERALRGTHGQLRSVLDAATQVAIIATDLSGSITTFNAGAERMLGYREAEVLGHMSLHDLHDATELRIRAKALEARSGCKVSTAQVMLGEAVDEHDANEWTLVRKDGSRLIVNMLTTSVRDEQERQTGHLAICLDITEAKRVEEELRVLSITDSLTGIYNRRYFQERLKSEVGRGAQEGLSVSVIMLDIDHFKQINDQHGHAQGDRVLQAFCQHISQRLRRTDVFCRLGGEEFMILCPGSNSEQAYHLAVELWQGLRGAPVAGVGVVTASFGVACWRQGEGADALLLRADAGVYVAKQAGRDRVQPELQ